MGSSTVLAALDRRVDGPCWCGKWGEAVAVPSRAGRVVGEGKWGRRTTSGGPSALRLEKLRLRGHDVCVVSGQLGPHPRDEPLIRNDACHVLRGELEMRLLATPAAYA